MEEKRHDISSFQDAPEDFVIATGEMHSVRQFVEAAFAFIGKDIEWEGEGDKEIGKEKDTGVIRYVRC